MILHLVTILRSLTELPLALIAARNTGSRLISFRTEPRLLPSHAHSSVTDSNEPLIPLFPSLSQSEKLVFPSHIDPAMAGPEHPPDAPGAGHSPHVGKEIPAAGGSQRQLLAAFTATDQTIRRIDL